MSETEGPLAVHVDEGEGALQWHQSVAFDSPTYRLACGRPVDAHNVIAATGEPLDQAAGGGLACVGCLERIDEGVPVADGGTATSSIERVDGTCPTCDGDADVFPFGDEDRGHVYCSEDDCGWIHRNLPAVSRYVAAADQEVDG